MSRFREREPRTLACLCTHSLRCYFPWVPISPLHLRCLPTNQEAYLHMDLSLYCLYPLASESGKVSLTTNSRFFLKCDTCIPNPFSHDVGQDTTLWELLLENHLTLLLFLVLKTSIFKKCLS